MQTESKHIYQNVAQKENIPLELVKSIGDAVFRSLSELQRNPPNLILNVKGLGRRFVRKSKVEETLFRLELRQQDLAAGIAPKFVNLEDIHADRKVLHRLMMLYGNYLTEKQEVKTLKDEYPTIVQSDPEKEKL